MLPYMWHWEERINSVTGGKTVRKMKMRARLHRGHDSDFAKGIDFFLSLYLLTTMNSWFLSGQGKEGPSRWRD